MPPRLTKAERQKAEQARRLKNEEPPSPPLPFHAMPAWSNVGSHAGRFATPIINYPEVAILAVGRGREGMVVNKGSFRVGLLLPLSLACDHRVVDGATAALALAEVIKLLQDPDSLLTPARG